MTWITIVWPMVASACLTLAAMHLGIWFRQTNQKAHLLISLTAISVAAIAALELLAMHARTPGQFGRFIWWAHIPVFFAVTSIVGFVLLYFGTGRPWLAHTVCALRLLDLIINFFQLPNANYQQINGLRHLSMWGDTISVARGVESPWVRVSELSSLLLLVFVVDASMTLWKRGHRSDRRRAVVVGGSIAFFVSMAAGTSALIEAGVIQSPYLISISFLAIVAAMGYEVSGDVVQAAQLAHELQAIEISLREAEERSRLVAEAGPTAMIMVDAEGKIDIANAQVESMFGYARGELIGQSVEILVPERFRSLYPEFRHLYFADPKARAMGIGRELFGRRKDGSEVPVEIGLSPIRTSTGLFVLASILDITQRRQAELEAARRRIDVAHNSRVSLLAELSGSLMHELNQPLTAIVSDAQAARRFLAQNSASPSELQEIMSDIAKAGERAGEVIRRLRFLLLKGEVQRAPLDLNELVRTVLNFMRNDFNNWNVEVRTELASNLPSLSADAVQVQQVLLNLLVNGCDAMAALKPVERRLLLRTEYLDSREVKVSVSDQGCGIPPEKASRIFEPFFTTKTQGLGLGLAICRSIISAHGGKLWATNNPERGAAVQFTLPTHNEGPA